MIEASIKSYYFSKKFFNLKIENKILIILIFFINKKNYNKFDLIICDDVLSWIDTNALKPTLSSIDWLLKDDVTKNKDKSEFYSIKKFCVHDYIDHYEKFKIYNFKQKNGHKSILLKSGKYIQIKNKTYLSKRFNKKNINYKEANIWSDTILKKLKIFHIQ